MKGHTKMPYKMIVLDLDDTLLQDDNTISPRTKQALMDAQETGVKVVLASGRQTYAMYDIAEVDSFVEAVNEPVVKVLMVDAPEKLVEVERKLQQELADVLSVMRSKPFFLEFTEKGVTKGTSLNHLIEQLGITREEVIAI